MGELSTALVLYGFQSLRIRRVEAAGIAYESDWVRDRLALGLDANPVLKGLPDRCGSSESSNADLSQLDATSQDFMDKDDDRYYRYISALDPNNYKDQDHYRVLGLNKLRYKATSAQIKVAYRQKVLNYHPDKGKAMKNGARNEAIFGCIQKAYEQLGLDEGMRRAYDSVDPKFNEDVPDASVVNAKNFFEQLAPVFERYSRFSISQPVPLLGDDESLREDVETFYDFWLHFKSWREFSYKDAEDKSKGGDRWERREIEKQNKVEREQNRKTYLKKLSSLVEMAYEKDPRVARFKEADRREKEEAKEKRRQEKQRRDEEKKRQEEEERQRAEQEEQQQREQQKRETADRQKAKKELQNERKRLRDQLIAKSHFAEDEAKKMQLAERVERICRLSTIEEISDIRAKLAKTEDFEAAFKLLSIKDENSNPDAAAAKPKETVQVVTVTKWKPEEIQLLIKATNLYPAGCVERWGQVTTYINSHRPDADKTPAKTEKDVIKQVRSIKSAEASAVLSGMAAPASALNRSTAITQPVENKTDEWSSEQQRQLETALKSIDSKDPQRWEKIGEAVVGKTKKQCQQRYKKLVQMLKDSKAS